jgi:hypothetical protein
MVAKGGRTRTSSAPSGDGCCDPAAIAKIASAEAGASVNFRTSHLNLKFVA